MFEFKEGIKFTDKKHDLLTVGELLIDMISEGYDNNFESNDYHKFFGGSPANIAMNVKRLGINPLIASAVGEDGMGSFLISHLNNENINTNCIQQVDRSTSMVLVTKSRNTPLPIFYRGADYYLDYSSEIDEAVKNSKVVHFSCWPISMRPARYTLERVIAEAKKNNCLVCFDPNYHPMIWQKGEDGVEYIKYIIGKVDIVKPSVDDAERLFGKDTHENQLEKFLKLGAGLVVMTLGSEGAIVSNGKETVRFSTMAKEVVDTTGAGDAFWSGFYTAIIKGYTIVEALKLGFAVCAYKLQYVGAVVELPKLEVIKDIYSI
ncbi:MAG TPA: sugar kinase [Mobilitalea sp.]|nr:sugar kinase [Mobilitalea sp.]